MRLETCACLGSVGYLGSAMMLVAGTRAPDRIWTPVRLAKRVPGWECVLSESGLYPGYNGLTMPLAPRILARDTPNHWIEIIPDGGSAESVAPQSDGGDRF